MFFTQAFKGYNEWWRYVLVTIIVFIGYQIGSAPLVLALWKAKDQDPNLYDSDIQAFMSNPDFSVFGINTNLGLTLMLLLFVAALTVFYFVFGPLHKRPFKSLSTGHSRIRWDRIFFAFSIWLSMSLCAEGVNYLISPEDYSWNFKFNTFIPLVLIAIFVLPLQTSFEELFFRGYLMPGIGTAKWKNVIAIVLAVIVTFILQNYTRVSLNGYFSDFLSDSLANISSLLANLLYLILFIGLAALALKVASNISINTGPIRNYKIIPLVITSLLFAMVHGANPEIEKFGTFIMMSYYIGAGLLLGIMTVMDDGLELALGTHAATNFVGAVFVGYDGAAITSDSLFKSHSINAEAMTIAFFVMAILVLFFLKWKFKWGSFSKLFDPIVKPDEDGDLDILLDKHLTDKA